VPALASSEGEYQYGYQPSSIAYTDQNGATQTITISYTTLAVNTAPLCALEKGFQCVPTVGSSVYVPSVITLPGGYAYTFNFEPNSLVDLESLTLPTGGVISWTYGQTDVSGDKVLTRTVVANGQTSLWKYNYAMSSTQGGEHIECRHSDRSFPQRYPIHLHHLRPKSSRPSIDGPASAVLHDQRAGLYGERRKRGTGWKQTHRK
jgi:hypothetical protein